MRNDFYITLNRGEFEKDGKKAEKNIELRVLVIDNITGHIKHVC